MIPFAEYARQKQRMLQGLAGIFDDVVRVYAAATGQGSSTTAASTLEVSTAPDPYAAAQSGSCPTDQHVETDVNGTPVCVPSGVVTKCLPDEYATLVAGHWVCAKQQTIPPLNQGSAANLPTFPGVRNDALQEAVKRTVQANRGMTVVPSQGVASTGSTQVEEKKFNWWWLVAGAAGLAVAGAVFAGRK